MSALNAHGFFLDGQNPVQYPARITLLDTEIRAQLHDSKKTIMWDFSAIDWDATRLLRGQLRIKHDDPDDAWLIVTDAALIAEILAEKKSWARRHFWQVRRELKIIMQATASTLAVCLVLWLSWPWLTLPLTRFVPQSTRDWMSDTSQTLFGLQHECHAADGDAALRKISDALRLGSPALNHATVLVVDASMLNAVTLANDKILVTRAIIASAGGPDEIAGVIAHEMGHVAHRHILRSALGQISLKILIMVFTGAHGDVLGYANNFTGIAHTRQFEAEADATAIELLRRAHVSPHGLGEFFVRLMHDPSTRGKEPPRYLSSHPPSQERAQLMLRSDTPDARPILTQNEWQALRNICGAPPMTTPPENAPEPAPTPKIIDDGESREL